MLNRTATARPDPAETPSILSGAFRLPSIGLVIVVTLIAFEAMAVAAALPTAARAVHGLAGYGWAFTGFLIANIVAMVASGLVCDQRGPRLPLMAGLAAFFAGLLVAGTAETMWQLVGGRVVQGLGSGLLLTAMYVVIGESYPTGLRPKIFAAISSAWVVPSLIGPPLAGFLAQHVSWRWVFLGLAPLVAVGGVLIVPALRSLRRDESTRTATLADPTRLLRALAVAVGIALLEQAGQHPRVVWLALAPVGILGVAWGLARLLPPGTLRVRRGVPTAVAFRGMLAGALFGTESLIPLALTVQHGYSATAAGLPLVGSAVGWAGGSWWQGRDNVKSRARLIRVGFAFVGTGSLAAAVASLPAGPGWLMYPAWAVAGVGAGLSMSSIGVLLLDWTNDTDRGRDSAALQLSDGVVSAFTTGLGGVLVAAAAHGRIGYSAAFVTVDLAMAVLAGVGVLLGSRARNAR